MRNAAQRGSVQTRASSNAADRPPHLAYWAAIQSRPKDKITLRQGARVVMKEPDGLNHTALS